MPYQKFTKTVKGKKKYCTRNKNTGKVRCFSSKGKRKTMIKMAHAYDSGWKPTGRRRRNARI